MGCRATSVLIGTGAASLIVQDGAGAGCGCSGGAASTRVCVVGSTPAELDAIVPGGASTRHMINREVLDALGPTGVLVNVARGSVVDEAALIRLRENKLDEAKFLFRRGMVADLVAFEVRARACPC